MISPSLFAGENNSHSNNKKFNAGEMIIEHVTDNHEWHILTYNHFNITVPLPIILYDGHFHLFSSSKFNHGSTIHKGFKLSHEKPHKGKIVKVDKSGAIIGTPLDFSITKTVVALWISILLILIIFSNVARAYKKRGLAAPKGLQSLLEPIILFIRDDVVIPAIGEQKYRAYLPYILTLFFFIFINNLLGLIPIIPGGVNVTGNIAITGILALFTFIITQFSGNKNYYQHIFNPPGVPWWLKFPLPLLPIIELMGVFTKPLVLMIRLFANMTAGHIIILGLMSIIFIFGNLSPAAGYGASVVSLIFSIFMSLIELLVSFIQAYVFVLLTSLYIGMAVEEHKSH